MGNNTYSIQQCFVKADLVDGTSIEIPYPHMRYDGSEEIYWYQDKALTNIQILDPNKKPQSTFKVFE